MRPSNILLLFAVSAVADIARYDHDSGLVVYDIEERDLNCKAVNGVIKVLKGLGGPATSFCSSYLQIRTTTITRTVTPPPSVITVVSATTVTVTTSRYPDFRKRDALPAFRPAPAAPAALRRFGAAEISCGCRCLQLPSKTARVTITVPASITRTTALTTRTTTFTTCAAPGRPCDCSDPGACCNAACSCSDAFGPVSTCL